MEVKNMSKSNTLETEQLTDAMYYILLSLMKERHGYVTIKLSIIASINSKNSVKVEAGG